MSGKVLKEIMSILYNQTSLTQISLLSCNIRKMKITSVQYKSEYELTKHPPPCPQGWAILGILKKIDHVMTSLQGAY